MAMVTDDGGSHSTYLLESLQSFHSYQLNRSSSWLASFNSYSCLEKVGFDKVI